MSDVNFTESVERTVEYHDLRARVEAATASSLGIFGVRDALREAQAQMSSVLARLADDDMIVRRLWRVSMQTRLGTVSDEYTSFERALSNYSALTRKNPGAAVRMFEVHTVEVAEREVIL